MNILKPALVLIVAITISIACIAQNVNSEIDENQFENCIPFIEISDDLYEEIMEKADKSRISISRKANYTIPVVFHVVHKNGPENISDSQIYNALDILNEDFNANNPDLVNVPEMFAGLAASANVTFKLAKQAPDGSCTNGINRYFSGYEIDSLGQLNYWTNAGQTFLDEIKSNYYWDVDKYLNIYIVNNSGSSGVSSFPMQADALLNSQKWFDGIMVRHYNLGKIGTAAENLLPHVLAHEAGHYFDLLHTWGDQQYPGASELDWEIDCENKTENCPDFYCSSDDLVEDTPNTKYTGSGCIYENESCGSPDNITNIMAYGCELMFTKGQVKRMHNALNATIANRNKLWSDENLAYTLNCSETPATKICDRIYSSFIASLEIIQPDLGIILTNVYDAEFKIRYKINDENWIELPETDVSYYYIEDIETCAAYELQISEKCGDIFSPWSKSRYFYTNGENIPIASKNEFAIQIETQNETYFNGYNGSISINAINGIAPYTYNWSTGETTNTLTNITAGAYYVTVSDFFGCSITDTIIVNGVDCASFMVDVVKTDETYFNENNGSILVEAENGISPYTINWNSGDTLLQMNNLSPGEYIFSIADSIGCRITETVNVYPVICDSFLVTIDVEEESFIGAKDASIGLVTTNGVSPLQYNWSTGDTTATINNLTTGDFMFTVTDAKGCTITDTITIETSYCDSLTVDVLTTSLTNSNASNATAQAVVSGGEAPYIFNWSIAADTLAAIDSLSAGTYAVEVTDNNLCTVEKSFKIYEYDCNNFDVDLNATYSEDDGSNNPSISIISHNGFDPLEIIWSTKNRKDRIIKLNQINYMVQIIDSIGCVYTDTIPVLNTNCNGFDIAINFEEESFVGANDATASIALVNGIPPFEYQWSTGDTTESIKNLKPGFYWVNLYDSTGCYVSKTFTIKPFNCAYLNYTIETSNQSYKNTADGSAKIIIDSLYAPYNFNWSTGDTVPQVTNLKPGNYYFTITDKNGCKAIESVIINAVNCNSFSANILIENATCGNFEDGSLLLTGFENAIEPVNYFWDKDTLLNQTLLSGLSEGFYFFDAIDNVGCGINTILQITTDAGVFIETTITPESSEGSSDGLINATITGGVPPYSYHWSTNDSTSAINNLSAGTYTLTVTDAEGCTATANDLLVETSLLCPEMNVINGNENLSSNVYQANKFIECTAVVGKGENITFRAASSISLNNGFEVPKGAALSIEIGACE